jgi:hypothetical protein
LVQNDLVEQFIDDLSRDNLLKRRRPMVGFARLIQARRHLCQSFARLLTVEAVKKCDED